MPIQDPNINPKFKSILSSLNIRLTSAQEALSKVKSGDRIFFALHAQPQSC